MLQIVHDFEHGGLTNDFLINTGEGLALLYNDKAPLENHHLAAAFALLRQPDCNFMQGLMKQVWQTPSFSRCVKGKCSFMPGLKKQMCVDTLVRWLRL